MFENCSLGCGCNRGFKEVASRLGPETEGYLDISGVGSFSKKDVIMSMANLTYKMSPRMAGYKTVGVDDVSARLVACYLFEQIKEKKKTLGLLTETRFQPLLGGRGLTFEQKEAVRFLIKTKGKYFGKTLLVTEHIVCGEGMVDLARLLRDEGVEFDIASVSVSQEFLNSNGGKYSVTDWVWLRDKIIYGSIGDSGQFFYKRGENGVVKNQPPKDERFLAYAQKNNSVSQSAINNSRTNIRSLANIILGVVG
jgi:hypothetical protein